MKKKTSKRTGVVRRPAAKRETQRKKTPASRTSGRKAAPQVPRVAKIEAGLKRYEKAARLAHERAEELSMLAHLLGDSAVEKFRVGVVAEWAERAFLRDVVDLRDAFAQHPPGSLPDAIESFRLLPDALIHWLEDALDLETVGEVGKVSEIPADRLRNYAYDFEPPSQPAQLVRIRVVSCGWKRNKALLIPPRVELVGGSPAAGENERFQP